MSEKIGFIGGGKMGEALIRGIIKADLFKKETILVAEPDADRRSLLAAEYGITTFEAADKIWSTCTTVVLAVKPQIMGTVLDQSNTQITPDHLIITIAAGLPIIYYKERINVEPCKIIRVMPNTPALVLESASAICADQSVSEDDINRAMEILNGVGKCVYLEEQYMDAVTGLSGSGPAYVFTFIEALIDAGVKTGLSRDIAQMLSIQTVLGSAKLLAKSGENPAVLKSHVTSPGGTTIAGLHVIEQQAFRGTIMDAVEAATNRSSELGNR